MAEQVNQRTRPQQRGMRARRAGSQPKRVARTLDAPMMEAPETGHIPAGWRVIGRKELADHLLSIRMIVLLGMLALVGAYAVYAIADQINANAGDLSSLVYSNGQPFPPFLLLFTQSAVSGSSGQVQEATSFAGLIAFIVGPLVGLAFGFDAISNERSDRTLPRLVSQPIHRDDVINGKFVASLAVIALMLGAVMTAVSGIGILRLGILPTTDVVYRLIAWYVLSVLYVGFWLALAVLCSVVFRRAATAVLVVLAIWLVLWLFGPTIITSLANWISPVTDNSTVDQQLANYSTALTISELTPIGMFSIITSVLLNPTFNPAPAAIAQAATATTPPAILPFGQSLLLIWEQIVLLVAYTVALFVLAYVAFLRQEVRA